MVWVWSDELANTLKQSSETAPLVPATWLARPCAFAVRADEDIAAAGRRLLGLAENDDVADDPTSPLCTCR